MPRTAKKQHYKRSPIDVQFRFRLGDPVRILNHVTLAGACGRVFAQVNRVIGREYRVAVGDIQHTISECDLKHCDPKDLGDE